MISIRAKDITFIPKESKMCACERETEREQNGIVQNYMYICVCTLNNVKLFN